ncbi:hypothetical protein EOM81_01690 [bacterium]|nr:hypothetical protein [bacterium]
MANKEKVVSYNEKETAIVNFLGANSDRSFTLAELSDALGFPVASGTIVSLMKKGNVAKGADREIQYTATKTVGSYGFSRGI